MDIRTKILIFFLIAGFIALIVFFVYSSINNTDPHYGIWKEYENENENEDEDENEKLNDGSFSSVS